jgi:manganese efflux pump family protein
MITLDILILGFALGIDAAVATFAFGVLHAERSALEKWSRGIYLFVLFGVFQSLMLWAGSRGGFHFTFSSYGHLFQLLISGVFLIIGSKIILDTLKNEDLKAVQWGLVPTLLVAVATSLDALAAGITLGTLPETHYAAIEVGLITSFLCFIFYVFAQYTQKIPAIWLQRISGMIFIFLGIKVVIDYTRLGGL